MLQADLNVSCLLMVILIARDRDSPWWAIPYSYRRRRMLLSQYFLTRAHSQIPVSSLFVSNGTLKEYGNVRWWVTTQGAYTRWHLSFRIGSDSFAYPRNGQQHLSWTVIYLLYYSYSTSRRFDHGYDADTILVLGPNSASIGCIANIIFVGENERNKIFVESVNSGSRRFNMSLDIRIAEILVVIDCVQLFLRIEWQKLTHWSWDPRHL